MSVVSVSDIRGTSRFCAIYSTRQPAVGSRLDSRMSDSKVPHMSDTEKVLSRPRDRTQKPLPTPRGPLSSQIHPRAGLPRPLAALSHSQRQKDAPAAPTTAVRHQKACAHPRTRNVFFVITFFAGTSTDKKIWNSHQPRLGITPLTRFRGPIARFGSNSLPGPLPLGW